jgi:hypothetical protein
LMYDQTPAGISESKTGISGSRSCTNIQTGVFAYEDIWPFRRSKLRRVAIKERHKFDRSADTQRLSVTGPPPTCPFI